MKLSLNINLSTRFIFNQTYKFATKINKPSNKSKPNNSPTFDYKLNNKSSKDQLTELLINKINNNGPITMEEYINTCLFHNEYGYYSTKDHIFGSKGDFITAPELSQLFGETLTVWIYKQLELFNFPSEYELLEIGPGKGTLALDISKSLISLGKLEGLTYYFIEKSPKLRKIQQEKIFNFLIQQRLNVDFKILKTGDFGFINVSIYLIQNSLKTNIDYLEIMSQNKVTSRFVWFTCLEDLINTQNTKIKPFNQQKFENFKTISLFSNAMKVDLHLKPMIIIANELFDALPINTFIFKDSKWQEILIGVEKNIITTSTEPINKLVFTNGITDNINNYLDPENTFKQMTQFTPMPENFRYELSIASIKIMSQLCILMSQRRDASALIIDYGEYNSFEDSFRGMVNQKIIKGREILNYSGECDLSCYVNFQLLASIVRLFNKLDYGGLIKQGDFLEMLGIYQRANFLVEKATSKEKENIQYQYNKLVNENEMGDNFKVMYIKKLDEKSVYPFIPEVMDKL